MLGDNNNNNNRERNKSKISNSNNINVNASRKVSQKISKTSGGNKDYGMKDVDNDNE